MTQHLHAVRAGLVAALLIVAATASPGAAAGPKGPEARMLERAFKLLPQPPTVPVRLTLVQPFRDEVHHARERSLVYIGGAFSHAFTKPPFLRGVGDGLVEQPHERTPAERLLAEHALEAAPGAVTYARVDAVPTSNGPRLMELELIEPDLGLRLSPGSIEALARAIHAVDAA